MKYLISMLTLVSILITGCSSTKNLDPDWSITVSKNSMIGINNEKDAVVDSNDNYQIDDKKGKKIKVSESYSTSLYKHRLGETDRLKVWKDFRLEESKTFFLVEKYQPNDNCQLSLHRYLLKKYNKDKSISYFNFNIGEFIYVIDFEVLNESLYIISNLGDTYQLHKFKLP